MVTISHIVRKSISENPFLIEALGKGLISHGSLAEHLKPGIEQELRKKVKHSAIIMALRRYEEELQGYDKKIKKFDFKGEIRIRTNILDINTLKTNTLLNKIKNIYGVVDFDKGDTLNIILGSNEVSIVTNEKYNKKLLDFLKGEKIISKNYDLVSLTVIFNSKGFINTPGVIFSVLRKLAWEQINIFEIISTMTELTFIISKKDSIKAYTSLQSMVRD